MRRRFISLSPLSPFPRTVDRSNVFDVSPPSSSSTSWSSISFRVRRSINYPDEASLLTARFYYRSIDSFVGRACNLNLTSRRRWWSRSLKPFCRSPISVHGNIIRWALMSWYTSRHSNEGEVRARISLSPFPPYNHHFRDGERDNCTDYQRPVNEYYFAMISLGVYLRSRCTSRPRSIHTCDEHAESAETVKSVPPLSLRLTQITGLLGN